MYPKSQLVSNYHIKVCSKGLFKHTAIVKCTSRIRQNGKRTFKSITKHGASFYYILFQVMIY